MCLVNYFTVLLYGLVPINNIYKLQLMQNFAARILTDTGKYDHITPALKALGWLTIEEQLWLRDVAVMYKCVNNLGTDH